MLISLVISLGNGTCRTGGVPNPCDGAGDPSLEVDVLREGDASADDKRPFPRGEPAGIARARDGEEERGWFDIIERCQASVACV